MRNLLMLAVMAIAVAGCSVQPLYNSEQVANLELRYAAPESRFEQVAYQTISQRISRTDDLTQPILSVSVSTGGRAVGSQNLPEPVQNIVAEVRVVAILRDASGNTLFQTTRHASANFQRTRQLVTDDASRQGAFEGATRSAADAVRLLLLAWAHENNSVQ